MRLDKVCKKFARFFASFHDYTVGQKELIFWWILRHDPIPVALVKRVNVFIDDGLWVRLPFERRQLEVLCKSGRCPDGQCKKSNANKSQHSISSCSHLLYVSFGNLS